MSDRVTRWLDWCAKHYRPKGASKFSIRGREWVRDQFFEPAFGWKLWPADLDHICDDCRGRIGEWVDWSPTVIRSLRAHRTRKKGCFGLRLVPNMVTVENLDRGAGKTTNMFGLLAAILDDETMAPFHVQFMASAGSQTDTLIAENLLDPIAADRRLRRRFEHVGPKVWVDHKKRGRSYIEFTDTSHRSITGRRRDLLLVDEARDVKGRPFSALLPSIRGKSQLVCPGHAAMPYEDDVIKKCSACREVMTPRIPRVVLVSTAGMIEGGETDWFNELVDELSENPKSYAHLFRSDDAGNPDAHAHETDAILEVFAEVPGLKDYLSAEMDNLPRRKGSTFVSKSQINRCTRQHYAESGLVDGRRSILWRGAEGSDRRCFGFLDSSKKRDETTLVIVADAEESTRPWEFVEVLRIDSWKPSEQPKKVINQARIQAHLDEIVPLYPFLEEIWVDCRGRAHGMAWAPDLVAECRAERPWGRRVKQWVANTTKERKIGWAQLELRILSERIWFPRDKILTEELLGTERIEDSKGEPDWRDISRKVRHADRAEGLAICCYLAWLDLSKPKVLPLSKVNSSTMAKRVLEQLHPHSGKLGLNSF